MAESSTPRVDTGRIKTLLGRLPLFGGLWDEELLEMARLCRPIRLAEGECLFTEGEPSDRLFIVLWGRLEISNARAGHLNTVAGGDAFGEIGMITHRPRTATTRALQESTLLGLSRDDFNTLLGRSPRISAVVLKNITEQLANHLIRMNNRLSMESLHKGG